MARKNKPPVTYALFSFYEEFWKMSLQDFLANCCRYRVTEMRGYSSDDA
jgi:hypothetical protein